MAARQIQSAADMRCATLDRVAASASVAVTVLNVASPITQLAARGIVPGAEIQVLRGHDPMIVAVGNTRWAISRCEAVRILVCGPSHVMPED